MAEVTLSLAVDLDNIKMKWRETYVSEGLNRKVVPSSPAGIYQGLRMIENTGAARQVEIISDADTGYHMAVFQSTTGFSLTYWDVVGNSMIFDLSDGDLDNEEVIIAMELDYQIGVDTTAEWKAFPVADFNALPAARRADLIILGTVNVGGVGTDIFASQITYVRTTMAWRNLSKGAISWSPIVRNGDFEQSDDDTNNIWYWTAEATAGTGTGTLRAHDTDPYRNAKSLEFDTLTTGTVSWLANQNIGVPVTPGQLGMVRFRKKTLRVADSGTVELNVWFAKKDGTEFSTPFSHTVDIDITAIDGDYVEVISVFEIYQQTYTISRVTIEGTNVDWGLNTTIVLRVDDVQVWIETSGERNDMQRGISGDLEVMGRLAMRDPDAAATYASDSLEMNYDSSGNQLNIDDQASSGGLSVDVNGDLVASNLTADTDVVATAGSVTAETDVVANTGSVTAETDVVANTGSVSANTTVDAGGLVTGGTGVVATTGDITATTGDLVSTAGAVSAATDLTVGNEVTSDLIPTASGQDLGSLSNRWDVIAAALDYSGALKHGDRELLINAIGGHGMEGSGLDGANAWSVSSDLYTGRFISDGADVNISASLNLHVGDRVKFIDAAYFGNSTASKRIRLRSILHSTGAVTNHNTVTHGIAGYQTQTLTIGGGGLVLVTGRSYWVTMELATLGDEHQGWKITYDRP